jgi:transcription termination factor NusB
MLPTKSNTADLGCSPVSSNCVIWQGPALPCLSLCTGDTVSSVIYKLADFLCNSGNQNLDIDLSCLTNVNVTDKSIENILTLLITKTCTLEDLINNIGAGPTVEDPLITIAQCFRTTDSNGDPVTTQHHTEYTRLIGLKVCTIEGNVSSHTTTLSSYGNRLTVLEQAVLGSSSTEGNVTLTCGGTTTTVTISEAILNLQNQVCSIRTAIGTNSALTAAAALQPSSLATAPALSTTGTMSALTGFKSTVSTTADTLSNLWVTLIDLRTAFNNIKDLIKPDCANVIVDFAPAMINNGTAVNLFFSGYSSVPTGWVNTDSKGSKLTITEYTSYLCGCCYSG